jgi:hypothetical protein
MWLQKWRPKEIRLQAKPCGFHKALAHSRITVEWQLDFLARKWKPND